MKTINSAFNWKALFSAVFVVFVFSCGYAQPVTVAPTIADKI